MTETQLRPAFEAWVAEKSISLCPTSLASDYQQAIKWVHKSPFELVSEGRPLLGWTLQQDPQKAARRVATLIKAFYRWASSEDVQLVPFNPVASFKFPKAPQQNSEVVVIPKDEVPFMMAALERRSRRAAQWHHYAMFQLQTGLRTGEVRAVQVGDIKGDRLLVHQNFTITHGLKHSTKTNKRRWVPINPVARGILDELTPDADGFLFPWNRSTFMAFFHDRMQELHNLGLIGRVYRPYDLRHTAITRWLEAGVSVATCASWAGNTAEVIWKHYAGADESTVMPIQ
jgi:integrase